MMEGLAGRRLGIGVLELEAFAEEAGGNAAAAGEGLVALLPRKRLHWSAPPAGVKGSRAPIPVSSRTR